MGYPMTKNEGVSSTSIFGFGVMVAITILIADWLYETVPQWLVDVAWVFLVLTVALALAALVVIAVVMVRGEQHG